MESAAHMMIQKEKARTALLWLGVVSITMLFGAFTSAYIVSMGSKNWMVFDLPVWFYYSTACIVLSSLAVYMAQRTIQKGNPKNLSLWMIVSFVFALLFILFQFNGWHSLTEQGVYFTGSTSSLSGSYLFVLTGLHIVHVFAGILALIITLFKAIKNAYTQENHGGVKRFAIYWHFLTFLWVYLLLFLEYV